jgi:hypothetical protein
MTTLNNGATLIAQVPDNRRPDCYYITAYFKGTEYVTWWMDADGNCHWGHYFGGSDKDKQEAIDDMFKRSL